jgi:hypothetical protein
MRTYAELVEHAVKCELAAMRYGELERAHMFRCMARDYSSLAFSLAARAYA